MAASGLLRERDLRVLTAVIQDGLRDDPGEAMPWVVLERLQQLIPSDTVALADHDVTRSVYLREQGVNDGGGSGIYRSDDGDYMDDDPRFWKLRNEFLPNKYSAPGCDLVSARRWSDFYTLSEMRNTPYFAEYPTPGEEYNYHLFVPLRTSWPLAPARPPGSAQGRSCRTITVLTGGGSSEPPAASSTSSSTVL